MKKRVMVVDDDHEVRRALVSILSDFFEVIEAVSGEMAVKLFCKHTPHIILMDIAMPGMSGIEATRRIKEKCPRAKIIGFTAYSDTRGQEMLDAGAREVIPKPVSLPHLLERIEWHLNHNSNGCGNSFGSSR